MAKMSDYSFVAGLLSTGLATLAYLRYALSGVRAARMQAAGIRARASRWASSPGRGRPRSGATARSWAGCPRPPRGPRLPCRCHRPRTVRQHVRVLHRLRVGILGAYGWFEHRYRQRILALVALPSHSRCCATRRPSPPPSSPWSRRSRTTSCSPSMSRSPSWPTAPSPSRSAPRSSTWSSPRAAAGACPSHRSSTRSDIARSSSGSPS